MARRKRQTSKAVGHGSEPLIVREIDPVDEHPSLGPLRKAKALLLARKAKGKAKIKVDVKVEANA